MRVFTPTTALHVLNRTHQLRHALVWVTARDRSTGDPVSIGFWTGAQDATFTINGSPRVYNGAGDLMTLDPLVFRTGLQERVQKIRFSQVSPAGQEMVRAHDVRHAPVEIHLALFDPTAETLIDEPHLRFEGYVDKAPIPTPQKNGSANMVLEVASGARKMTKPLNRKRSDASLKARNPSDRFREYASLAGTVETPWGRGTTTGATSAPASTPIEVDPQAGGGPG